MEICCWGGGELCFVQIFSFVLTSELFIVFCKTLKRSESVAEGLREAVFDINGLCSVFFSCDSE